MEVRLGSTVQGGKSRLGKGIGRRWRRDERKRERSSAWGNRGKEDSSDSTVNL